MASTFIQQVYKGYGVCIDSFGDNYKEDILKELKQGDEIIDKGDWSAGFRMICTHSENYDEGRYGYVDEIPFNMDASDYTDIYALGSSLEAGESTQDHRPEPDRSGSISTPIPEENEISGYSLAGFALCFVDDSIHVPAGDMCVLFSNKNEMFPISWREWAYDNGMFPYKDIGIFPLYTKAASGDDFTLQYTSPIVVNRNPSSSEVNHRIKSEDGYSGQEYCGNQINFLELALNTDNGIYANNEDGTLEVGGEYQKVIRIPSNDYLYNENYGMHIIPNDSDNMVISKYGGEQIIYLDDSWIHNETAGDTLEFKVSLNKESSDSFTEIGDTLSYKFLGICVIYTATEFKQNYILKEVSDKCFFIAKTHTDNEGNYKFNILCHSSSSREDPGINKYGFLYVTPVFEAQREVYLTEPIIVKDFPNFNNTRSNGDSFGKGDALAPDGSNIDFGYTEGSSDINIFNTSSLGNFKDLGSEDIFSPKISVDAGFVELFDSWEGISSSSNAWKHNMTSSGSYVSQTTLGFNQTSYGSADSERVSDLHDTYINTAELDNNSLYLYIHGYCDTTAEYPTTLNSSDENIQDYQANINGYEMVGFVVYFKTGSNLTNIENWRDPSQGTGYTSYFAPLLWSGNGSNYFSSKIKIDFSEITDSIVYENYLAISPVYLKSGTKTITLGNAQTSSGGDLSSYVSNYIVNVAIGDDSPKQYSQGDSIEVSEGDTITITYSSATISGDYTYVGSFTIGGKTYSDGASIGYDDLEDGTEFHPIFSYTGETFTFKNDTARSIEVSFNGSTTSTQIGPWEEMEFIGSSSGSCKISILTPGSNKDYIEAYSGNYNGENAYDLISSNNSFWNDSTNTSRYQANLYISVPSKGIDIYKLDFYQGNGSCSVLTNSDSDVAVRFVALPWDAQSAETYHLSQFINSLGNEDFKEFYLRGKLPMNLNAISYSSNKKFKSMKCETAHVVPIVNSKTDEGETNEPSHDLRDIYIRENVGFDIYYIDKVSDIDSIRDTWAKNDNLEDETNKKANTLANTVQANDDRKTYDEYGVFTGNGVYNFIIKGSAINAEDKSTYDYEIYNCGPLVGYVEEQDSNTPIDDEDEFFLGVTQPGSEVVTAFGWETVEGERQLMTLTEYDNTEKDGIITRPFYAPNIINPGSWSDSGGTYNDNPAGPNYTTTENEVTGSLMSMEEMPKDYCAFQTGNQFIQFRLRNPYDGSVLNFDEKSAYTVNKGVWQRNTSTTTETESETMLSDTTHEQTNFLTLWEQRSLFNALNGKPTYVNEVISYITYNEKEVEDMALNADTASADNGATGSGSTNGNYCFPDTVWYDAYLKGVYGLRDAKGNIVTPLVKDSSDPDKLVPNDAYYPDEDIEFVIPARNGRKAGRALVDNIDDWVQWYKREETAGVIAGGNTSAPGGTPVMFVGPLLNKEKELCIESDATRSNLTLGPGESITVPIVVLYKCYEADGRDSCKYTVGFDLRNSQYQDPLYYEFTCSARYAASVTDTVSSQKASVNSNVKYNVTVR